MLFHIVQYYILGNTFELSLKVGRDVSELKIKDIFNQTDGVLSYFKIDKDFLEVVKKLYAHKICSSFLFERFFERTYSQLPAEKQSALDHLKIMEDVVKPTLILLRQQLVIVLNGQVDLDSIMVLFDKHHVETELLSEFQMLTIMLQLGFEPVDLQACASKICCVFQLKRCVDMSNKILIVKEKLRLNGDFTQIVEICSKVCRYVIFCFYQKTCQEI